MGRNNCIALNDSESSANALEWYIRNHHQSEDVLTLLHVYEAPRMDPLAMGNERKVYREKDEQCKEEAIKFLRKYEAKCTENSVNFRTVIEGTYGAAGQTIVEWAQTDKVDCVIMAQRGLTGITRVLLGSTSDYVLHNADVPVIVIPPPCK